MDINTNMHGARWRTGGFGVMVLGLLMFAGTASAQVELPLGGHFRAGRCMPVKVDGSVRQLLADGAVPTRIGQGVSGIVPLQILVDSPGVLRAGTLEVPLRPLSPNERLVGVAGADAAAAAALFGDRSVITVPLDASQPLAGPAMAWETLDAVVLDSAPANIGELLALGMTIAVRASQKPDDRWPWERVGEAWVVRADLAGPSGAIGGETVYVPTHAWAPGRPEALRRQIVLVGVLVLLLLMSALLIRGKRAILAMVGIAAICSVAIELWRRRLPAVASAGGMIVVRSSTHDQRDTWSYLAAGSSEGTGFTQLHRPIIAGIGHASLIHLTLECDVGGSLRWSYTLPPNARLATLHRTVEPKAASPPATLPVTSPLYELARQGYLSSGAQIEGQAPAEEGWPTVVIRRN